MSLCLCSLTYELVQEDEWGDVTGQAQELADDHEPVPRLNGEGHHQQFSQDEGGEGNGNDVDELWLEEQQRSVHDDAACGAKRANAQPESETDTTFIQRYKRKKNVLDFLIIYPSPFLSTEKNPHCPQHISNLPHAHVMTVLLAS